MRSVKQRLQCLAVWRAEAPIGDGLEERHFTVPDPVRDELRQQALGLEHLGQIMLLGHHEERSLSAPDVRDPRQRQHIERKFGRNHGQRIVLEAQLRQVRIASIALILRIPGVMRLQEHLRRQGQHVALAKQTGKQQRAMSAHAATDQEYLVGIEVVCQVIEDVQRVLDAIAKTG